MCLPYFIVSGQAVESAGLVAEPSRPPDAGRDILGTRHRIKRGQSKKGATSAPRHARRSDGAAACPCLNQRNRPLDGLAYRSEEHTSELQSLMRSSYAVFCLKKKNSS